MAKVKGISQAIIDSFKRTICFYTKRGQVIAQKWPRKSAHKRSPAELFNWQAMRAAQEATKALKPSVRTAYKLLATGTDFMWQDLFNSQFLKEYYKNHEAPCYVRDFSYTKAGPRIIVDYDLSKENPHTITRHNISKYGVVIPVGNKMCKPGCDGPPDPAPDEEVEACEFQGEVSFTDIPEDAEMKKVTSVEEEFTCIDTWADLLWKWWSVGWEAEAETPGVSFYGIIALLAGEYLGLIKSSKIHETISLLAEDLGVPVADVYKAWFACEGSPESEDLHNFDCIWDGDWYGDYKPGQSWKDPDNVEHPPHWYLKIDEPGFLTWYEEMKIKYGFPWSPTYDPDEITWKMVEIVVNEIPYESSEETAPTLTPAGTIALGKGNCDDQSILWFALCYKALLEIGSYPWWINKHASIVANTCYDGGHVFGWWQDKNKCTHIAELTAGPAGMPSSWKGVVKWDWHGWQCVDYRIDKMGEWECKQRIKKLPGEVGDFKCIETGDVVSLQRGKVSFGNALPYIGEENQSFHFESIESPTVPQQPCCPGNEVESYAGGIIPASTFKVKFCYEMLLATITGTQTWGRWKSLIKWNPAGWTQAYDDVFAEYLITDWTEGMLPYLPYGTAVKYHADGPTWSGRLQQVEEKTRFNIGAVLTPEQFEEVEKGVIKLDRSIYCPRRKNAGALQIEGKGIWENQLSPTTVLEVPKTLLAYPVCNIKIITRDLEKEEFTPPTPSQTECGEAGCLGGGITYLSLMLYRKGEYPHIDSPPFGFNSPYWLKFTTKDEAQPVISPFFRIT